MASGAWLRRDDVGTVDLDGAGSVIREYRVAVGRNQVTVAAEMGITQQHLSHIEQSRRQVSLEQRRRFIEVLDIPPEALGLATHRPRAASRPDDPNPKVSASRGRWRAERRWLNQHRNDLARIAVGLYGPGCCVPRTPLIAAPEWIASSLPPLRSLTLELDEAPKTMQVTGREEATAGVRPLRDVGAAFDSYTAAIKKLDPPSLFESRPSYRLLNVHLAGDLLGFGLAAYFDKLDISEALGHELAAAAMAHGGAATADELVGKLPLRELVGDPFDLGRRAVIPAITTLTIRLRRYPADPSFLLHWRDPSRVATAGGVYDVIPAGEFQPSSVALWDRRNDFDLWRNVVREYSEELLGAPEHDGTRTEPIDYGRWPLYQQLEQAQAAGTVTPLLLGIGLDALTLAATILTVVVIDDDVFETVFGAAVRFNEEGEIVSVGDGRPAEGVPFTRESVDRMLDCEPMASPGAACLALAWQHRRHLIA